MLTLLEFSFLPKIGKGLVPTGFRWNKPKNRHFQWHPLEILPLQQAYLKIAEKIVYFQGLPLEIVLSSFFFNRSPLEKERMEIV